MTQTTMLDLEPAARTVADLLPQITDEQLGGPTPCEDTSVAALLDHLLGLTLAFTRAAPKAFPPDQGGQQPGPGSASAAALDSGWRRLLPKRLRDLVLAWREPAAWTGETRAGGVTLPGAVAGTVALSELVIHGWDLARATTKDVSFDAQTCAAVFRHVTQYASPDGTPGLFGPAVDVATDRPLLDRAIGLSGRDPGWTTRPSG